MDFFSPSQKAALSSQFDNLHQTFGREIFVFKESEVTRIITDENKFMAMYGNDQPSVNVTYTPVSGSFLARIFYLKEQDLEKFVNDGRTVGDSTQPRVDLSLGVARIRVSKDGELFLKDSERVILDDNNFEKFKDGRPHGLFNPNYYDFYFRRVP